MNLLLKINKVAGNQISKYGAQYTSFALFIIINYPFAYIYELHSNKFLTDLWLRLIPTILCCLLLLRNKWPIKAKRFLPIFWYLTIMMSIPVIGGYMLLKNNFAFEWLINFNVGTVLMMLLIDIMSFIFIEITGLAVGALIFYIAGNSFQPLPNHEYFPIFFYMLFFLVICGAIFTRNKETYNNYLQRAKDALNEDLEQKVHERTSELEKALLAKTEFLNNMSHEIRTPIQGFTTISEGLYEHWDEFDNSKKRELTYDIATNARRLASLVGGLLDLSKFNSGKMTLDL